MRSFNETRWSSLLRLTTALTSTAALAALALTLPAQAQTTVAPSNPPTPYVVQQAGQNGQPGNDGNSSSGPGTGQNGAVPANNIDLTVPGNFQANGSSSSPTVQLSNSGGNGGNGGSGANLENSHGGDGGNGANSTTISATFDQAASNPNQPITITNSAGPALSITTQGGNGGTGGISGDYGQAGIGGTGGNAGEIDVNFNAPAANGIPATITGAGTTVPAMSVLSVGGNAGDAGSGSRSVGDESGPTGQNGGNGGTINATVDANVRYGINAISQGGNAGAGGQAISDIASATGGNGGLGGNGGDINLTLTGGSVRAIGAAGAATGPQTLLDLYGDPSKTTSVATSLITSAVSALSLGGLGGAGGDASGLISGHAGAGGAAGAGGDVTISIGPTTVQTSNYGAIGVAAISVGGAGGDGAQSSSLFRSTGGNGAPGGTGGIVQIFLGQSGTGYQLASTSGVASDALVGLSVGGGGGYGGDVSGGSIGYGATLGGHGANGGDGGQVAVNNGYWYTPIDGSAPYLMSGYVVSTTGKDSRGVVAESVGGGGGRGGSAFSATAGFVSLAIGGVGGQGGDGGLVAAQNLGIIQTSGVHSVGMDAMSVGGGGGEGGAAVSIAANSQFTAAVAVGGSGGTGGVGGAVQAYNLDQILTFGSDAYGVRAQSVGGGGGEGGAAVALALQPISTQEIPSISLSVALGGSGGNGGSGGPVEVLSAGLLGTSGNGAAGVLAQSIGGGGGTGGDSSALQTAYNAASINVAVSIGGTGGKGGDGDAVTVYNSGLLYTLGAMAPGVKAESIGGGGGDGGYGVVNSGSYNAASGPSVTATVAVGGSGGVGGDGGNVAVYNYVTPTLVPAYSIGAPQGITPNIYGGGAILTSGDGSAGIVAQSVGGGGGNGGHATADGSGGQLTVNIAVGGTGGAGGAGGSVLVDNGNGAILTKGANADGVFAQSVGGGGGTGGHAATGSGANPLAALEKYVGTQMAQALNIDPGQAVVSVTTDIWAWKDNVVGAYNTLLQLQQIANGYAAVNLPLVTPPASQASTSDMTVTIGGGWGGKGGAGGDGGTVTVNSAGSIETDGPMSAGIFAQSVGGGGGDGGAANPSTSGDEITATSVKGSIAVGGTGGSSGDGGAVNVANSGVINTSGDLSFAIFAQSIGGGGGVGGVTAATSASNSVMNVSIGGNDQSSGTGGAVTIANNGLIATQGESAYAILAQSVGGGGGLASVFGAKYDPTTGGADSLLSGSTAPTQAAFGSGGGGGSTGGPVTVNLTGGEMTTNNVNASGVVAQSIGGGGGIIAADNTQGITSQNVFSHTSGAANGGAVTVNTGNDATITTNGAGAAGIVAQSLAGGGIIQGLNGVSPMNAEQYVSATSPASGGPVNVTLNASIYTAGAYAPGIFAQSAGLGAIVGNGNGQGFIIAGRTGSTCGSCADGTVQVTINSSSVISVSGQHSYGVALIADGNSGGQNTTNLQVNGGIIVAYGAADGAVFVGGANGNTIGIHDGAVIDGSKSAGGYAFAGWGGVRATALITFDGNSTVKGSILLYEGSTVTNAAGSTFDAGPVVNLGSNGTLTNNGTLHAGLGEMTTTTLTGNFVQGASGVLEVNANNKTGQADLLAVQGTAQLGGQVELHSTNLINQPVTVLTATGGVTSGPSLLQSTPAYLFSYDTSIVGNSVQVQPQANFIGAANGLSSTSQQLANLLQQIWNSGGSLNGGFSALAGITDPHGFGSALNSVAGAAVRGVVATRQAASDRFFDNMVSCQTLKPGASPFQEENCGWLRVVGGQTSLASMDGDPSYHQLATTSQTGGQFEFSPGWFIGGSLGLEQSWLSGDNANAKVSGQAGLAGLMIKHQTGPWLLSADLDSGFGSYQSTRTISVGSQIGTANGSPDVFHIGGHVRAAYQMPLAGAMYVEPSLTVGVLDTHLMGYGETGSTSFNLNVHGSNNVTASASPMLEFGAIRSIDTTHSFRVFADVGMGAYSNSDWGGEANLELAPAGTGSFTVDSKLPSVVGKFKAGVDVQAGGGLHVKFVYSADVASGFLSQVVVGRLSYAF